MAFYITYAEYAENLNSQVGRDLRDHCFKDEEISNLLYLELYIKHPHWSLWLAWLNLEE